MSESYLSNYTGYLHVDGYKAYEKTEAKLVGCWAHARRKFIEAEQSQPKGKQGKGGKIQWAVSWFQKLYRVEQALKDKTREERYVTRQSKTQSLLNEFKAWLDKSVTQVPPKSKLGEAISYSLNQWSKLVRVIDDGGLSMDNNRAERSVRPFTVGRNNWLFSKMMYGIHSLSASLHLAECHYNEGSNMLTKNVIAIDLAKNVLQACHISVHGEMLSNKPLSRQKMKEFLAKAKPSIVAMEGCCGCHYWGQLAQKFGHEVRIINPKKVKGYLEGHKTDHNDALAIANAAIQIGIKYSRPKSLEQQSMHSLETSRRFLSRSVVSLGLHIRGTILGYGIANGFVDTLIKSSILI